MKRRTFWSGSSAANGSIILKPNVGEKTAVSSMFRSRFRPFAIHKASSWELQRLHGTSRNRRRPSSSSDRKSTRLNSSHMSISYAVFCLKKKKINLDLRIVLRRQLVEVAL